MILASKKRVIFDYDENLFSLRPLKQNHGLALVVLGSWVHLA